MTVRDVQADLGDLLARMAPGEMVTVLGEDGTPQAVVVRIKPDQPQPIDAWAELERLGAELGAAWPADKTAAEAVAEIRR